MSGYIVNTAPAWYRFIRNDRISNPVFWFKRENNPNSKSIIRGNYIFLRITGTSPPVIKSYGKIVNFRIFTVEKAFEIYGNRLGYDSIGKMIEFSSGWTSTVKLDSETNIFCVEINQLQYIQDIRVDKDLEPIGILFDYQHIVTGKGLNEEQTSALLQIIDLINPELISEKGEDHINEPTFEDISDEKSEEEFTSDSARYLESHLQWFVFNNLSCLGIPSVKLYDSSVQQETQGKYRTDEVGEMDLLLKSKNNDIYVIELKKAGTDKTVGQICRYMGWVKHRIAKKGQIVNGIIVTQDYDHRLSYAANVVNNLKVKKIQVSFKVTSEQLELPE